MDLDLIHYFEMDCSLGNASSSANLSLCHGIKGPFTYGRHLKKRQKQNNNKLIQLYGPQFILGTLIELTKEKQAGSWWPEWDGWLATRDTAKQVSPPKMGGKELEFQKRFLDVEIGKIDIVNDKIEEKF